MTRLSQHELAVTRLFDRTQRGRSPAAWLRRALRSPLGNYLVNTPMFLVPRKVKLRPKHRVLEIGCSRGANLRFLTARIRFHRPPVGIDLSRVVLREAAARGREDGYEVAAASASRLPFADASFDLVLAPHVARHLSGEGLIRLLVEVHRVLAPGGVLALWEYTSTAKVWGKAPGWMLDRLGGRGQPRRFDMLAHWASEANYDVIENPDFRPFLFPPIPRVSMLARKPPRDSRTPT
ncbi:MAG: class I SAM-dependent methyltransferase [Dehalococcoidia bacterium]